MVKAKEEKSEQQMLTALMFNGDLCEEDSLFKKFADNAMLPLLSSQKYQGLPEL